MVDALLGTGVRGALREPIRSAVEVIGKARAAGVPIVAVDTPTAVDLSSGEPSDPAVHADLTVTFHRPEDGAAHAGGVQRTRARSWSRRSASRRRRTVADPAVPGRQPGWREVLLVAGLVVAVVLGAAMLTSVLPTNSRRSSSTRRWRSSCWSSGPAGCSGGSRVDRPARPSDDRGADPIPLAASQRSSDGPPTSPRWPRRRWDVVIVGGGIVGCGALLDAVSRGLRAALVEQDDIAAGTSSRSSRLIHGGLRYLEQFRFGLVREALAERSRLLALAPHLVRLEPLLFPIYGDPVRLEGVLRRRADALRHPRGAPRRWLAPAPVGGRNARTGTDPAPRRAARRAALPRRRRGRCALHAGRRADGDRRRWRGGHAGPRDGRPRRAARRRHRGAPGARTC